MEESCVVIIWKIVSKHSFDYLLLPFVYGFRGSLGPCRSTSLLYLSTCLRFNTLLTPHPTEDHSVCSLPIIRFHSIVNYTLAVSITILRCVRQNRQQNFHLHYSLASMFSQIFVKDDLCDYGKQIRSKLVKSRGHRNVQKTAIPLLKLKSK